MSEQPFKNIQRQATCIIGGGLQKKTTILDYLAKRFTYMDKAGWAQQITLGNLQINGELLCEDLPAKTGMVVDFTPRNLTEPPVSWNISILYEDENLIFINKPGDLPCHPGGKYFNHTLWAWLKQIKELNPFFAGRLDRETSGIVAIAKNGEMAGKIVKSSPHKTYLVAVHGKNLPEKIDAEGWMGPDLKSAIKRKRAFFKNDGANRETAHTTFTKLKEDRGLTLLKAELHTGRTHQIRATLCSLGYPVVGDKLYGLNEELFLKYTAGMLSDDDIRSLLLPHQALHSWKLDIDSLNLHITAPIPETWAALPFYSLFEK